MKNILITSLAILALSGCGSDADTSAKEERGHDHMPSLNVADAKALGLATSAPAYHNTGDTLLLRGMVDAPPQSIVDVALPYGGVIKMLNFYPGTFVKKGTLLAEVNHQKYIDMQENYLVDMAAFEEAEAAWNRQETLNARSSTSEKVYLEARTTYRAAKSKRGGAEARLKLAGISAEAIRESGIQEVVKVYAPVSGYITDILANIGKYVPDDATIYRLVDTEHLHIELSAYPDDIASLHQGQKVYYKIKQTGAVYSGEIHMISQTVDDDRTVRVHVHPDRKVPGVIPGMFVQGSVVLDQDSIWGLPLAGALMRDGRLTGLALENGQYTFVDFGSAEILRGEVVPLDPKEKRPFVTRNLEKAMAAYLGGSEAEAGHSH